MAKSYTLHRGGQKIQIQKESQYFTAILPDKKMIGTLYQSGKVSKIKQVFNNVYKLKAEAGTCDEVMDSLRDEFKTLCVFHHAYTPLADPATRYYITDTIIITFKKGIRNKTVEKIMREHGVQYMRSYDGFPDKHLFRVTSSAKKNPVKVCVDLDKRAEIIHAEPNLINRFGRAHTPKDDLFKNQWHLNSKSGIDLVAGADISAPAAWEITKGSRDVVVAVIDDGFDLYHPDFKGEGKVVHAKDFIDGDAFPFPRADNDDYHGTPCAGVAIGEENGSGIVGVAPDCAFMPIRFDVAADDNMVYEIFNYVGPKADVISCSWGFPPVYAPLSTLLKEQFTKLSKDGGPRKKGCVIVFAAGNYNAPIKDLSNKGGFEWRHPTHGIRKNSRGILNGYPEHKDVVSVAASTSQNRKSAYSNWGKEITVCAPSDNWHPTDPEAYVPGRGIWTTDNETFGIGYSQNSRYTGYFGGTSSACPLVAGVAALIISANPELSSKQVRKILTEATDKIIDKKADIVLKNKKGTYDAKGHSEWFGYGKVNAEKAVKAAVALIKKKAPPKAEKKPKTSSSKPNTSTAIKIVAALINPKGRDSGSETVSLLNISNQAVDLNGWSINDTRDRSESISGISIAPGAFVTITLKTPRLSNSGGSISLKNADGKIVQTVNYKKGDTSRDGWSLAF